MNVNAQIARPKGNSECYPIPLLWCVTLELPVEGGYGS